MAESAHDEDDGAKDFKPNEDLIQDIYEEQDIASYFLNTSEDEQFTMKDLLSHLQTSIQENAGSRTSTPLPPVGEDVNSNDVDFSNQIHSGTFHSTWSAFEPVSKKINAVVNSDNEYKITIQDVHMMLQELNNERTRILRDIENEEKERQWFLNQIEKINYQRCQLPVTDNYPIQSDLARQTLDQNTRHLQESMQKKLGSNSEILQRNEIRIQSLHFIEKESLKLKEQINMLLERKSKEHTKENDVFDDHISNMSNNIQESNSSQMNEECTISGESLRNNKMTTSATQTTVDLYPTECSINNQMGISGNSNLSSTYHGTWPLDKVALWHSGPTTFGELNTNLIGLGNQDTASVMSFTSSMNSVTSRRSTHQLGAKVEMVYSLLSMFGTHDKDEMSKTLLTMSTSRDSCVAMRQSGCLPLLIQLLHSNDKESGNDGVISQRETRIRASKALHNIVHANPDDKRGRREARVLRLLEQIREYSDSLRGLVEADSEAVSESSGITNTEQHPGPAMAALMKLSFDEEHRHAMCQLGGLQAIAELIEVDYASHNNSGDQYCVTLRRYAGMALTNLTFGDGTNKALLCSMKSFMQALVAQLHSPSEDLRQVIASVLRNLSWRADPVSKKVLREVGAVTTLMKAAIEAKKESTLKSILSALWNLSAHCSMNKADICAVEGALAFLVGTLTYKSASKTLAIIENGGGILRNISSQIAVREDYRAILRQHNCLQILLQHLRSSSLTVVSNACGTLWNLSARCSSDQLTLWEMGAVSMLRNLVHSKHKMISMGSSAALKNLLAARPQGMSLASVSSVDGHNKPNTPSLLVRKQRALEAEIDQNLSETCDNIDSPKSSPTHKLDSEHKLTSENHHHFTLFDRLLMQGRMYHSVGDPAPVCSKHVCRSDSRDSITSTRSDTSHDRLHMACDYRYRSDHYPSAIPELAETRPKELETLNNMERRNENSQDGKVAHVMQEVAHQIALDDAISDNVTLPDSPHYSNQKNLSESSLINHFPVPTNSNIHHQFPSSNSQPIYDKYCNFSNSKIENLNLLDQAKCNLKFHKSENEKLLDDAAVQFQKEYDQFSPKINNFVQDTYGKDESVNNVNKQTSKHWQDVNCSSSYADKNYVKSCNVHDEKSNVKSIYGSYAETDLDNLDEPTNYGLLYSEVDRDNFVSTGSNCQCYNDKFTEPSVSDDSLTRYCTEGTPLNFSKANSVTDLSNSAADKLGYISNDTFDDDKNSSSEHCHINENDSSSTYHSNQHVKPELLQEKSVTSEKLTTYCLEDTPVCFSRVSSLSSLHSSEVTDHLNANTLVLQDTKQPENNSSDKEKHLQESSDFIAKNDHHGNNKHLIPIDKVPPEREGKSVSFGEENFAEETPLMFSRCSSLGSLSSFDQHSIHDDRSSVVSDFSRRASGIVSPSDLPDSPSQSMPSSPKHTKPNIDFSSKPNEIKQRNTSEDEMIVYAVEYTPVPYSTATSLSSLIIEDDVPRDQQSGMLSKENAPKRENAQLNESALKPSTSHDKDKPNDNENCLSSSVENLKKSDEEENLSDPEENEDDILAACINSGMPNNSKQSNRTYNNSKLLTKVNKFVHPPRSRTSGIPTKTNNVRVVRPQMNAAASLMHMNSFNSNTLLAGSRTMNENLQQKTIDKHSNPSVPTLSFIPDSSSDLKLKADSSNNTNDCNSDSSSFGDELLLEQCIQSGMPKQKPQKRKINKSHALVESESNRNHSKQQFHQLPLSTEHSFSQLTFLKGLVHKPNDMISDDVELGAADSVHNYAEEGTPELISRHHSLSSLSFDEESNPGKLKQEQKVHLKGKNSSSDVTSEGIHSMQMEEFSSAPINSSPLQHNLNKEHYKEDKFFHKKQQPNNYSEMKYNEQHQEFQIEDTPLCFSRNSSLSSLSVDSFGLEPSASDQAILDECINSGMPKNKHDDDTLDKRKTKNKKEPTKENSLDNNLVRLKPFGRENTVIHMQAKSDNVVTKNDQNVHENIGKKQPTNPHKNYDNSHLFQNVTSVNEKEIYLTEEKLSSLVTGKKIENDLCDSKLLELEAGKLAQEIHANVENFPCGMDQSVTSSYSDLENVKPPSILGDVVSLNCSMISSCASDSVSDKLYAETEAKQSRNVEIVNPVIKKSNNSTARNIESYKLKNIPELVLRALSGNADNLKSNISSEFVENAHYLSGVNSIENLSMHSSYASELLDNVKPPSILEDVDLNSSTYSVASITSEVADAKSENVSMKGSFNSDVLFECIKPVVAMAELYVREGMPMASLLSSCNSEIIENINPPSAFQEVTDCNNSTVNDISATLGSDTDTEDELPEDMSHDQKQNSIVTDVTVKPSDDASKTSEENSTLCLEQKDNILNITPEEVQAIRENANLIVSTLIALKHNTSNESSVNEDNFIECETLSLVSNDTDSSDSESDEQCEADDAESKIPKCPRIVKPDLEPVESQTNENGLDKGPKPIRGKRKSLFKSRQQQPLHQPSTLTPVVRSLSPRSKELSAVKPTRTSALRASQSQQKSPAVKTIDSTTITIKRTKSSISPPDTRTPKPSNCALKSSEFTKPEVKSKPNDVLHNSPSEGEKDENRPKPPIKQGTFTKEKPSQGSTPKISPTKSKSLSTTNRTNTNGKPPTSKMNNPNNKDNTNSPARSTPAKSRMLQSRSLDERTPSKTSPYSRTPSVGSQTKFGSRRIQSPSPMNRKVSNSLNNLKKGSSTSNLNNSSSSQNLIQASAGGRRTPNSGLSSRSGSGTLSNSKRSSSNLSLCSNNSSNTTASTLTTVSTKKTPIPKKEVTSKVASLWKKTNAKDKNKNCNSSSGKIVEVRSSLPRSSTYEKISKTNVINDKQQVGMRLEDKNQINNKTFTKSPSVDSKLDDIVSDNSKDIDDGDDDDENSEVTIAENQNSQTLIQVSKSLLSNESQLARPKSLIPGRDRKESNYQMDQKTLSSPLQVTSSNYPSTCRNNGQTIKSLIPTPTKSLPSNVKFRDSCVGKIESRTAEEPKKTTCMITTV